MANIPIESWVIKELLKKICSKVSGFNPGRYYLSDVPIDLAEVNNFLKEKLGIKELGENYLYKTLFLKCVKNDVCTYNSAHINKILLALRLGENIEDFKIKINPVNEQLETYIGKWYRYRRHTKAEIWRLPVEIYRNENMGKKTIHMRMRSGHAGVGMYDGELKMMDGCLFANLESKSGKPVFFSLHVGKIQSANCIRGISAGMNSAPFPFAARVVLQRVKNEDDFDEKKMEIQIEHNPDFDSLGIDKRIYEYLEGIENILNGHRIITGELSDLTVKEELK